MSDAGPLAQLIIERRDATGTSLRGMAHRAQSAGVKLSHAQLAYYVNGDVVKAPDRWQVEALALALEVPYSRVLRAVLLQWYKYDIEA